MAFERDPAPNNSSSFTDDLKRAAEGDTEVRHRLWSEHYETLRGLATQWLDRNANLRDQISIGGTHIANAAYERLHDRTEALVNGKQYFFRVFYTECLRIAIDYYRKNGKHKGRGSNKRVEYPQDLADHRLQPDLGVLDDVLTELRDTEPRAGEVAMLKIFGIPNEIFGTRSATDSSVRELTDPEIAELLGIGLRTVEKDWAYAKGLLHKRLGEANE